MTVLEIMAELEAKGSESVKKIFLNHGIKEPLFGVKIADLKIIQKKVKKNHSIALELFATENADAMYLAGLLADEKKMTLIDLQNWANAAKSTNIIEYIVPWITAESNFGVELATIWLNDTDPKKNTMGWLTWCSIVAITKDENLDLSHLEKLLQTVKITLPKSENNVKAAMNMFVISVGSYVISLTDLALETATIIGKVTVTKAGISCKIPEAIPYIMKIKAKGSLGKKKKKARC